jgi:hypothetical protein
MSLPPGDATIQKISTDGTVTVSVDFTIDLDARHDHLTEKRAALRLLRHQRRAGLRRGGRPGAANRPGRAMLPYPGGAMGLSGSKGSSSDRTGRSSSPITAISTTAIRATRRP